MENMLIIAGLWLIAVPLASIVFMLGIMIYDHISINKRQQAFDIARHKMLKDKNENI